MSIVNDDIFPKQLPKVVVMFEINLQMGIGLCEEMSLQALNLMFLCQNPTTTEV